MGNETLSGSYRGLNFEEYLKGAEQMTKDEFDKKYGDLSGVEREYPYDIRSGLTADAAKVMVNRLVNLLGVSDVTAVSSFDSQSVRIVCITDPNDSERPYCVFAASSGNK